MKKPALITALLFCIVLILILLPSSCIIKNPQPEECDIETKKIIKIEVSSSNDIVFSDNHGDYYYINKGIERGLILDSLNAKVLNKTVTLHLPKLWFGTSEHIAQLAIDDDIIFTEFK